MFTIMEATGWKFLPAAGGLGDQDEVLMDNIFAISYEYRRMKKK